MADYRRKLQDLLIELFQFNDSGDLDFGIYAIMNYKRDEIVRFIERDLLDAIEQGLQLTSNAQREQAEREYEEAVRALGAEFGDDPAPVDAAGNLTEAVRNAPGATARALRDQFEKARGARAAAHLSADLEAQVYNDLYRFFARYYDDGDFISQRRYGAANKYAIPYNGEEVFLYWANFDQYYVKSGESFTDYRFGLPCDLASPPAAVQFKLQAASVAQDNVKGDRRFFVLAGEAPVAWDADARTLTVAFEYRPLTGPESQRAGTQKQQEKLNADAEAAILAAVPDKTVKARLAALEGEKERQRTVLARHLGRYTARNTRDYFIHKDLRGFLARELDFYLKSEVLRLEDVDWKQPGMAGMAAARLGTVRLIAGKVIAFLSQIEEFQKRLWEKRKFVVQSDYCVTLDRVPEALYPEIAANDAQRAEWVRLFAIDEIAESTVTPGYSAPLTVAFLKAHPFLVLDTGFFDARFRDRLVGSFDDLDGQTDGLLVHGENFQALRLLEARYRGQVKCIYIDPPYNTDASAIDYKNGYKASSWMSLINDRTEASRPCLTEDGVLVSAIDDEQHRELSFMLDRIFGGTLLGTICVRSNPSGRPTKTGYSVSHEYLLFAGDANAAAIARMPPTAEQMARFSEHDEVGPFEWRNLRREGSNSDRFARPALYYPIYISDSSIRVPEMSWNEKKREWEVQELPKPSEQIVLPDNENGDQKTWRWGWETVMASLSDLSVRRDRSGRDYVYHKRRPHEEGVVSVSSWFDAKYSATEHGTALLKDLFGHSPFSYPKSIYAVMDAIWISGASRRNATTLDYFAGSGTTAHAVINLNREDGGHRKYILVEVADHFDTVLRPRIQKVVYAADWKDGKPVPGSPGQSHMFHYVRLESYEDALNNVRFRQVEEPLLETLHEMPDYLLSYLLEYETAGSPSLLDLRQFDRPFDYRLNITRRDVSEPRVVDLVTTFNFLLGLRVRTLRRFERAGRPAVRVTGQDGSGQRVCVLWRDIPPLADMEAEKGWLQAHVLEGVPYDRLYINGESPLPGALPIEPEFKRLMFEGVA